MLQWLKVVVVILNENPMTARDDLEISPPGKTSLCHKGHLKNSTTSCLRSIPLTSIYRLVIHVSLGLLLFTFTFPGFISHLPIFTPTFHPIYPRLLKGIYISPSLSMFIYPHLIARLPMFTLSYLHFTPFSLSNHIYSL